MNSPATPVTGPNAEFPRIDKSSAQRTGNPGPTGNLALAGVFAKAPQGLTRHALSGAFPDMSPEDYERLKGSIAIYGVQHAIVLYDGEVLEGWHRYRAASELKIDCPCIGPDIQDPQQYVFAANAARRHLTASQLAFAAVSVYAWLPIGSNQHGGSAPGAHPQKSTAEVAKITGLSERIITYAKSVKAADKPDVADKVKAGRLSLKQAAEQVKAAPPIVGPAALPDPGRPRDAAAGLDSPARAAVSALPQQQPPDRCMENRIDETDVVQVRVRELEGQLASLTKKLSDELSRSMKCAGLFAELQQLLNVVSANEVVAEVKRLLSAKEA